MKKITAIFIALALMFSFNACKSEEFCNIISFTDNFNKCSEKIKLSYESYIIEADNIYYAALPENDPIVLLKLTENEKGKLGSCSVTLAKYDSQGKHRPVTEQDTALFYETAKTVVQAFTAFNGEESKKITDEFFLYDPNTIKKQGETNKTQNSFRFVYYSNSLVSMFTVINTWLCEIPKTEKPESKPYFGNTTNVDGESIKLN